MRTVQSRQLKNTEASNRATVIVVSVSPQLKYPRMSLEEIHSALRSHSSRTKHRASTLSDPGHPTARPDLDRLDSSSDPGHRFSTFTTAPSQAEESQSIIIDPLRPATQFSAEEDATQLSYGENASTHSYVSFDTESGPDYTPQLSSESFQRLATQTDSEGGPYDVSEQHLPLPMQSGLDDTIRQTAVPLPARTALEDIVRPNLDDDSSSSFAADAEAAAAFAAIPEPQGEPSTRSSTHSIPAPEAMENPWPVAQSFVSSEINSEPAIHVHSAETLAASNPQGGENVAEASKHSVVPLESSKEAEVISAPTTSTKLEGLGVAPSVVDAATASATHESSSLAKSESIRLPRNPRLSVTRVSPVAASHTPVASDIAKRVSTSSKHQSIPNTAPRSSMANEQDARASTSSNRQSTSNAPPQPTSIAVPAAVRDPEKASPNPYEPPSRPIQAKPEPDRMSTHERVSAETSRRPPLPATLSQMDTQYVNMLLALDGIPVCNVLDCVSVRCAHVSPQKLHNMAASFATWILLAGFVLFPGTFTSLQEANGEGLGGAGAAILGVVQHVPL